MKQISTLFFLLPYLIFGQDVLDYRNVHLRYWAETNEIDQLTTEYEDEFESYGRFKETIKEELAFDHTNQTIFFFKQYRAVIDTTTYPEIKYLIQKEKPDSSYTNSHGSIVEIYTTPNSKHFREYLLDKNGQLIFENIWPRGDKPIYISFLQRKIRFDKERKIQEYQTFGVFGRNDWEFYFDTLGYIHFSYSDSAIKTHSWKKEVISDYRASKPTIKVDVRTINFLLKDTVKLSENERMNNQLKTFFKLQDLNRMKKIEHREFRYPSPIVYRYNYPSIYIDTRIEYFDPVSEKSVFSSPPYSRHKCFQSSLCYGYQEMKIVRSGRKLYNYLISDTSLILIEVFDMDRENRILNHHSLPLDYDPIREVYQVNSRIMGRPFGWRKTSYKYINDQPLLVKTYKQKRQGDKVKNPERTSYKLLGSSNLYEDWLTASLTVLNKEKIELKSGNKKYQVTVKKSN